MIRLLHGEISLIGENNVVLDVSGVGYLIHTPTNTTYVPGEKAEFLTHLAVRENALDLYGFASLSELQFFELLLTIPKIGPKSALQIMTQASINLLSESIRNKDADHLHKISGLGKKTAENIVSYLQNKVDLLPNTNDTEIESNNNISGAEKDAIDALITLGYDPKEAREYVGKQEKGLEAKALIQAVLRQIPSK